MREPLRTPRFVQRDRPIIRIIAKSDPVTAVPVGPLRPENEAPRLRKHRVRQRFASCSHVAQDFKLLLASLQKADINALGEGIQHP